MSNKPNLDDYVDVAERMREFFVKYPNGSFQSECQFAEIDGRWTAVVKTYAYRTPDDQRPGTGHAYEFIPGRTPYTKDSELQNAETAAIGRAILSVGAADTKRGIASREEVRNRTYDERANVSAVPAGNAEGREALRLLCGERGWELQHGAELFEKQMGRSPKSAPNEDLLSFVQLVRNGLVDV